MKELLHVSLVCFWADFDSWEKFVQKCSCLNLFWLYFIYFEFTVCYYM